MNMGGEDSWGRERAAEVARRALSGEYDILLACRDLSSLRTYLQDIPEDIMDGFEGVASEVDDLPIGTEREFWAPDAFRAKDVAASKYREEVRDGVTDDLRRLLAILGK